MVLLFHCDDTVIDQIYSFKELEIRIGGEGDVMCICQHVTPGTQVQQIYGGSSPCFS